MKYNIIKQGSSEEYTEDFTESNESYYTESQENSGSSYQYKTINDIKKVKGKVFTKEEVRKKIENHIALKTMNDKKRLMDLTPFKTWIKYYNTTTNQFKVGGLLMKVAYPDYITLMSTYTKVVWSVQLRDNIIFIPNETHIKQLEIKKEKQRKEKSKEEKMKEKLFELYKSGKLVKKY